jgi:hypothetical protein
VENVKQILEKAKSTCTNMNSLFTIQFFKKNTTLQQSVPSQESDILENVLRNVHGIIRGHKP